MIITNNNNNNNNIDDNNDNKVDDNECFKWCLVRYLDLSDHHAARITKVHSWQTTIVNRAKQILNDNVVAIITYNEYKDLLLNNKCLRHLINIIQSKDQRIGT